MARTKKTAQAPLAPEQLPSIPVEEQPYPLPEGWKWVQFGTANSYIGKSVNPALNPTKKFELYSVPSLSVNYPELTLGKNIGSSKQLVEINDILICKINPRINRVWHVHGYTKNTLIASSEWIIFRNNYINHKYLVYYFSSQLFRKYINENVSGVGGSLMRAQPKFVATYPIPLPPIDEQQRIVERIESLFAKLDEAKEKAESVVETFEKRKAALIYQALNGELTKQWKKQKGIKKDLWNHYIISNICHDIKVGIVITPSKYYTDFIHGTASFRSANVRENYINDSDWVYINDEGMKIHKKSIVHTGDILVVRSGNPGTACVVTKKYNGYNAIDIIIAVPDSSKVISEYLCLFTNSPLGKNSVAKGKRGMALAHFNVKSYANLSIVLPSLPEQQEIVRILDELLAREERIKEAAEKTLERIDLMKKAILARAFRGELGTNVHADNNQ